MTKKQSKHKTSVALSSVYSVTLSFVYSVTLSSLPACRQTEGGGECGEDADGDVDDHLPFVFIHSSEI